MSRAKKISILILGFFFIRIFTIILSAQPSDYKLTRQEYIEKFKDEAIKEMHISGVPASITLAQAILESGDGNSPLAKYANNHFGIKCHKVWNGETFIQDDDAKNECFRKYYSAFESFRDHSDFLKSRPWYAPLFDLKVVDYKGWAYGLKKAGYATNPKYPELLINIIETNKLHEFDKVSEIPKVTQNYQSAKPSKLDGGFETYASRNNIKYIIAGIKDTPYKIAKENQLELWQVYKYNDLEKEVPIKPGDIVYLKPKKNRSKQEYHIVEKNETMHFISQLYGVKLKKLYQKNNMPYGSEPNPGDKIFLKKRKK
jgi:hypothetical protein